MVILTSLQSHDRLYSEEEVYQMELPEVKRLIEEEVGLPWDGLKYYGFVGPGRRKAMEEVSPAFFSTSTTTILILTHLFLSCSRKKKN